MIVVHRFRHLLLLLCILFAGSEALSRDGDIEPIKPIIREHGENLEKASLGEKLFHDPGLSTDNTISCSSCHQLDMGGADIVQFSFGVRDQIGVVNTPTVYNSRFNHAQFWDGRAATLEEQAAGPVHNPIEMASNWNEVINKLSQDPSYVKQFKQLYNSAINAANITDAIVAFERTLITPDSPFDRWLNGEKDALTEEEIEGYRTFKSYGCIACHQGVNVGGNMYQQMGALSNYFADLNRPITPSDFGRFNVTGKERDKYFFKVPSLRLVTLTPPYFHDGSVKTLNDAIKIMAKYQLRRSIEDEDVERIIIFLKTLVGKHSRMNP